MNSIQTCKRERGQQKRPLALIQQFEEIKPCFQIHKPPHFVTAQGSDRESFKNAVDGVLGLASLITNSDCDTPQDWVQPYSIVRKDQSTLPTGIQLTTQKLLKETYEVYFSVRK